MSPVRLGLVLLLSLLVFGVLALAYPHDPVEAVDEAVAEWVAGTMPGWAEWSARPFSWVGGWIGLVLAGTVAVALLVWRRAWLDATVVLAAFAGSQLTANLLKLAFDRPRPEYGSAVPLPPSPAFPSGHAAAATACVGALAVVLCARLAAPRARALVWAAAAVLGAGIAASRVVLGVHWVSDVVAGAALGLAWLSACLLVREALRASSAAGSATLAG